jgi:hypothetical protein
MNGWQHDASPWNVAELTSGLSVYSIGNFNRVDFGQPLTIGVYGRGERFT